MKFKSAIRDESGFSLTELLVVIVIIGVLASLAIPKFLSVITKAKTTEAKLMLKQVYNLEKSFYMENDTYTKQLAAMGFEPDQLVTEGGQARYRIEVTEASAGGYLAKAIAVVDFDKDGAFNTWSIDQTGKLKEEIPD